MPVASIGRRLMRVKLPLRFVSRFANGRKRAPEAAVLDDEKAAATADEREKDADEKKQIHQRLISAHQRFRDLFVRNAFRRFSVLDVHEAD